MTVDPDQFCSSCAWPYECAASGECERRARGQIRSRRYGNSGEAGAALTMPGRSNWFDKWAFETTPGWAAGVARDALHIKIIGIDLASGPDHVALAEYRDGRVIDQPRLPVIGGGET